jgi:hypothetical protein
MKLPSKALPLPEIYYDGQSSSTAYWRENNNGGWQKINDSALHTELVAQGFNPQKPDDQFLSELNMAKRDIQLNQDIVFAGPLAGLDAGLYSICGNRILVTQSPRLIEPCAGDFTTIRTVIDNLLNDGTVDQTPYFYGWLKIAYESVRARKLMPGQALALAGPKGSGKSLLQNLITEILGGRVGKPYQFMTGGTNFNSEIFASEHLMIEDESASIDIRARRHLSSAIKNITVNTTQRCHPKNRTAITLTPFWRLSISLNEEPENLMVLPPIDESLSDKIMLLKAFKKPMPMASDDSCEREKFWNQLKGELPAFLDFLVKWTIPEDLKSQRFGIAEYHHPDLIRALTALQPETHLLALIDEYILQSQPHWTGTAEALEKRLTSPESGCRDKAQKLFYYPSACGSLLGRLAKMESSRVRSTSSKGRTTWHITRVEENKGERG